MFNYGFMNPVITKTENAIYIKEDRKLYMFYKINSDINSIIKYTNEDNSFYKSIKNKDKNYITRYKNDFYILYKIDNNYNILESEIINKKKIEVEKNDYIDWIDLWQQKVDKIDEFIDKSEEGIIRETKDYYIGLGETAIDFLIYNRDKIKVDKGYLCRKRIDKKNFRLPNNAIIDCKEREIAEYIKYNFFKENKSEEEIFTFLKKLNNKDYDHILIYSRLLFPTYYFDLLEEYLNNKRNINEEIKKMAKKINSYELFLKKLFIYYFSSINNIEWINNNYYN